LNSSDNRKKAIVFISAGLGDAILLVPLVKTLRQLGYEVTGLVTSSFPCEALFEGDQVFDRLIDARSKTKLAWLALKEYKLYQLAILNYFASTRTNLFVAQKIATMVHTNRIPETAGKKLVSALIYFEPVKGIHDAEQNMLLAGQGKISLTEELLQLKYEKSINLNLPDHFFSLQICAGHNAISYKNWPTDYWIHFLKNCAIHFPKARFVLLGDSAEKDLAAFVIQAGTGNVISLCGETTVGQAMGVIARSQLFLGLDGGLMHAAAALGKPSFSIWGPSNPILYGYEGMNPEKHRVISLRLSCSPCSAWINPNTSRFSDPEKCPDLKCLNALNPEDVFKEFSTFAKTHALV
jgi:ADP-heptose:LPS heptosyltransferase